MLRLLLDTQLRKLQFVYLDPGNVPLICVLLYQDGFKRRLRADLFKAITKYVRVNAQRFCERPYKRDKFAFAQVLPGKDDVVNRSGGNQRMTFAIIDDAAWRRYGQQSYALILRNLSVVPAPDELEVVEPYAK